MSFLMTWSNLRSLLDFMERFEFKCGQTVSIFGLVLLKFLFLHQVYYFKILDKFERHSCSVLQSKHLRKFQNVCVFLGTRKYFQLASQPTKATYLVNYQYARALCGQKTRVGHKQIGRQVHQETSSSNTGRHVNGWGDGDATTCTYTHPF